VENTKLSASSALYIRGTTHTRVEHLQNKHQTSGRPVQEPVKLGATYCNVICMGVTLVWLAQWNERKTGTRNTFKQTKWRRSLCTLYRKQQVNQLPETTVWLKNTN